MDALQRAVKQLAPLLTGQVIIPGQRTVILIGAGGPQLLHIFQQIAVILPIIQLHGGGHIVPLIAVIIEYISPYTATEEIQIFIHIAGLEILRLPIRHAGTFQQAAEYGQIQSV